MQRWREWRTASAADWGTALQRVAVIRPLAEQTCLAASLLAEASTCLGLGRVPIYHRIRCYRQRPQTPSPLAENACHTIPIRATDFAK